MSIKHLLEEVTSSVKKISNVDLLTPRGLRRSVVDSAVYEVYVEALSEGLSAEDKSTFKILCENTRQGLMENSMFQLNPYESLTLPVLRVFYPKLIAKELVNVMPIDKPDVIKGFIRAKFQRHQDSSSTWHNFPSVNYDISKGPGTSVSVPGTASVPGTENLFSEIPGGGLTSSNAHIEKDFRIIQVVDSTGNTASVNIIPTVDGVFSAAVELAGVSDVLQGSVDYETGVLKLSSVAGVVSSVSYVATASLEENRINPVVRFEIEKINLTALDRRISAEWTINMEQDTKALFDVSLQAEFVNLIGEQIAIDIDSEIINDLIAINSSTNPGTHTKTFNKIPPTAFTWGTKLWYENVIPVLDELSAQVYNSCLMGAANVLACNPLDAAIFESLNTFEYVGNSVDGGELGYRSATVQGGKWKILVSSIVPQGSIITKYRSNDNARAAYIYAPYCPALLTPYPIGAIPSLTVLTRYAKKSIRPEAIGVLSITNIDPSA